MRQDKKGRFAPVYTKEEFDLLVNAIRFGKPEDVYKFLDTLAFDERTKWRAFDKAVSKARELSTH